MNRTTRRKAAVARRLATGAAALALSTAGLVGLGAGAAHASDAVPCRGWTGSYPDGTQLNPCNDTGGTGSLDHWYGYVYTPRTDIRVTLQLWNKPSTQPGEPTHLVSSYSPTNAIGPSSNSYYINGGYVSPTAGYCYYTRLIATDTGAVYGPAESPATCF